MAYNNPILIEYVTIIQGDEAIFKKQDIDNFHKIAGELGLQSTEKFIHERTLKIDLKAGSKSSGISDVGETELDGTRFWSADKKKLIQISPKRITVNLMGDYEWEKYRNFYVSVIEKVGGYFNMDKITILGLQTIDRFKAKATSVGDYINCGGDYVPGLYRNEKLAFDITLGLGFLESDGFNKQFRFVMRPVSGEFNFFVDSIFQVKFTKGKDLVGELEGLRKISDKAFEGWITDKVRNEIMGGIRHANN